MTRGFDLLYLSVRFHQTQAPQNASIRTDGLGQSGVEPTKVIQRHAQMRLQATGRANARAQCTQGFGQKAYAVIVEIWRAPCADI